MLLILMENETNKNRREKIVNVLKKAKEELSTSKISFHSNLNYYVVQSILEELSQENKISKESVGNINYWRLN